MDFQNVRVSNTTVGVGESITVIFQIIDPGIQDANQQLILDHSGHAIQSSRTILGD